MRLPFPEGHNTIRAAHSSGRLAMAKKPNFPSKTCPKCGKLIRARSHSHPECGWVMASNSAPVAVAKPAGKRKKKLGRPKKVVAAGGASISLDDIRAVKELAEKIGAEKVKQLAQVLAK